MPFLKNGVNPFIEARWVSVKLYDERRVMTKWTNSILIATVSLGLAAGSAHAQDRSSKDELDSRVQTVNSLADKRGGMKEAIHDVSVETGVPVEQIQRMRDQHPDAGAAGIMIACVIADNAKGSPEAYLSRHVNGKGWAAIARDNNVPLDKINARLDKLERDLGASGQNNPANGRDLPATGRDRNRNNNPRY
jgi:hypothetical protein